MHKNRLEAFSDGVIAILITIMVLELKVPHGQNFANLFSLAPVLLSYVLSFVYLAIYWNNHHHLFQAVRSVQGGTLWANMHLLFWLSLIPFATAWAGENDFAAATVATYGVILTMSAVAYYILVHVLTQSDQEFLVKAAVGKDFKGLISIVGYLIAIAFSFWSVWVSGALYVGVALMWLVPDRRIERTLRHRPQ